MAPTVGPARPRVRRVRYEPGPGDPPARAAPPAPPPDGAARAAAREFVEAHRVVTRILRLALEVLDGRRPPVQLAPHFAPGPLRYWRAATAQRTARAAARHGRLRLCLPRAGAAEVAVTCRIDGRVRALAARFERLDAAWCCTAVRLG